MNRQKDYDKMSNENKQSRQRVEQSEQERQHQSVALQEHRQTRQLVISTSVFAEIQATIGQVPAETGGMLGGNRAKGLITKFHFDRSARRTGATYSPDYRALGQLLDKKWNPAGYDLIGFIHSHPQGIESPSFGDRVYARDILKANPHMDYLFLPIVMTEPDTGHFKINAFLATLDGGDVSIEEIGMRLVNIDSGALRRICKICASLLVAMISHLLIQKQGRNRDRNEY